MEAADQMQPMTKRPATSVQTHITESGPESCLGEEQVQGQGAQNDSAFEPNSIRTRSVDNVPSPESTTSTSQSPLISIAPGNPCIAHPPPPQTPQDITLAELKAQKTALLTSLANLPAIQVLIEEGTGAEAKVNDKLEGATEEDIMAAANKIVKEHIKLLHEYNELKDVGQGLMGLIADQRGVRIVDVQDEFGIEAKD
ncbi:hypothetical protein NX059_012539 [Plenodomus lindquistii]|nr:hypothetical protein NX059_012539 [Plenodomus lindquistii]